MPNPGLANSLSIELMPLTDKDISECKIEVQPILTQQEKIKQIKDDWDKEWAESALLLTRSALHQKYLQEITNIFNELLAEDSYLMKLAGLTGGGKFIDTLQEYKLTLNLELMLGNFVFDPWLNGKSANALRFQQVVLAARSLRTLNNAPNLLEGTQTNLQNFSENLKIFQHFTQAPGGLNPRARLLGSAIGAYLFLFSIFMVALLPLFVLSGGALPLALLVSTALVVAICPTPLLFTGLGIVSFIPVLQTNYEGKKTALGLQSIFNHRPASFGPQAALGSTPSIFPSPLLT